MKYRQKFSWKRTPGILRDGTLIKQGKQVVLFKIYDGFAIPKEVAELPEVDRVQVHYEGDVYSAPIETFFNYGIPHKYKDEEQLVLSRKWWLRHNQGTLFDDG